MSDMATASDLERRLYPGRRMPRLAVPLGARTREEYLGILEALPEQFRALVIGLTEAQLDTPYRPGGWTVRQVVHHVPDSHLNAYVRVKLALTEDVPTVKPY